MSQSTAIPTTTITNSPHQSAASQIDDPQTLHGLFPPDSDDDDEDENDDDGVVVEATNSNKINNTNIYEIQSIDLVGKTIHIRQYDYHSHNANRIWPGTFALAEYLLNTTTTTDNTHDNENTYVHQWGRILELGTATGLLTIRMAMASTEMYFKNNNDDTSTSTTNQHQHHYKCCCCTSIVTSDVNDEYGDIVTNLQYNYNLNNMSSSSLPIYHIPHTWGSGFYKCIQKVIDQEEEKDRIIATTAEMNNNKCQDTTTFPQHTTSNTNNMQDETATLTPRHPLLVPFDTIIASDILLYVSSYPALVETLSELMIPSSSSSCNVVPGVPLASSVSLHDQQDNAKQLTSTSTLSSSTITTSTTATVVLPKPKPPKIKFIMSWNRRLKESQEFFIRMKQAGFSYEHHGKGIYTFLYNE